MTHFIQQHLMLPGPTPLPNQVLQALATPLINHRGEAWSELYAEVAKGIQWVFQTDNTVFTIPGAGTAGMEAAVVNMLSPGDQILVLTIGPFGERFAKIAHAYGACVERLSFDFGQPVNLERLQERLNQDTEKKIKAVLVTHNETSTGVLNPLEEIARMVRSHEALILVDAISGLISTDLPVDKWDLDVVIGGSQKAFMIPPGLAFVSVSERAWEAYQHAKMPKFYFDFQYFKEFSEKAQTPWTPPISLFFGLRESLKLLKAEGFEEIFKRHYQMMVATRAGVKALGCALLVEKEQFASRAVTAIRPPEGISADGIRKALLSEFNMVLAGGQGALKGQIFRMGHLGYQGLPQIYAALACLEVVLKKAGHTIDAGCSVAAAQQAVYA